MKALYETRFLEKRINNGKAPTGFKNANHWVTLFGYVSVAGTLKIKLAENGELASGSRGICNLLRHHYLYEKVEVTREIFSD